MGRAAVTHIAMAGGDCRSEAEVFASLSYKVTNEN